MRDNLEVQETMPKATLVADRAVIRHFASSADPPGDAPLVLARSPPALPAAPVAPPAPAVRAVSRLWKKSART